MIKWTLIALALAGCATVPQPPAAFNLGNGPQYDLKEVVVYVLPQRDVERLCKYWIVSAEKRNKEMIDSARPATIAVGNPILGCLVAADLVRWADATATGAYLYSIENVWVLLHEFKHFFIGWFHP